MSPARGPYRGTPERRREILDAARVVFAESGYRAGSLKDIAVRIGIDASSILHHFGSKAELLEAVLEDKQDGDARALGDPTALSPEDIPAAMIRLAERNESAPGVIGLYTVLAAESTTIGHPSAEYFRRRHAQTRTDFLAAFARMERAGLLADGVDAEYAASSTFALWDGIQAHWLVDSGSVDPTDTLRRHLAVITRVHRTALARPSEA